MMPLMLSEPGVEQKGSVVEYVEIYRKADSHAHSDHSGHFSDHSGVD